MGILPGQTEAHEQHGSTENALEVAHHGNAPAFASNDRCPAEGRFERPLAGLDDRPFEIGAPRAPAVQVLNGHGDTRRRDALYVRLHECRDGVRTLIGHEPEADLRHGDRGEHGFGALAGVAAQHAVHFAGGASPQSLERGVSRLAAEGRDADLVHEMVVAERQFAHLCQHGIGERTHGVVEAGNGDFPVGVVHAGQDARECHGGIHHRTAVHPGVQVAAGTTHGDLKVRQTTQRRQNAGNARREHGGVRDHNGIAGEPRFLAFEELLEVFAPDFLLAFGQHDHVHRQRPAHREMRLERLDVQIQLSLVVNRSTRIDAAVAHRGLERRRGPQFEGLGRLHVIVSVHEQRGRIGTGPAPFPDHDGVSRRRFDARREADTREGVGNKLCRGSAIGVVLGACADAWNAQEGKQLVLRARIIGTAPGGEISGNRGSSHDWCSAYAWSAAG